MRRLWLSVIGGTLVACGLSVTGTAISNSETSPDAGSSSSSTSSSSSSTSSSSSSGGDDDSGPIADAGSNGDAELDNDFVDAGGCVASLFPTIGQAIHFTSQTVTVDGELADWTCDQFARLDRNHAQLLQGDVQAFADYAIGFDNDFVYFAYRVTDTSAPRGNDDTFPYNNDSIELYLGPNDNRGDGTFVSNDLHIIVDWRNEAHVYNSQAGIDEDAGAVSGLVTAVTTFDKGFSVEGKVPVGFFNGIVLPSTTLAFDVQINDCLDDGNDTRAIMWNYQADAGGQTGTCGANIFQSACDTLLWGQINLQP